MPWKKWDFCFFLGSVQIPLDGKKAFKKRYNKKNIQMGIKCGYFKEKSPSRNLEVIVRYFHNTAAKSFPSDQKSSW